MRHSLHRAFALLFAAALPALASNGVIEINQAKVLAGDVTPGDLPGFPVTISANGSYILTSDLNLTAAASPPNTNGIEVTGQSVTIDLNGFTLFGTTQCSPPHPITCAPLGTGNGIEVPNGYTNLAVRNGTIRGLGNYGIHSENGKGNYEDLTVSDCGSSGLRVQNAIIQRVQARLNGDRGIDLLEGLITDSIAVLDKSAGIFATFAILENCSSSNNGAAGIQADQSNVRNSYANVNQGVELSMTSSSWSGNTLLGCGGPCQSGSGNLQLGPNNCEGVSCP